MSLARYLSKLGALLNSSGQVPDSGIQAVAASKLTGQLPAANALSGSVLQVVQSRTLASQGTSSSSFVSINGLITTLTPVKSNSRFLVQLDLSIGSHNWYTNGFYIGCNVSWSGGSLSTILGDGSGAWVFQYGADSSNSMYETLQVNDSAIIQPNTANALTFTPVFATLNASYPVYVNRSYGNYYGDQGSSRLTVMEIAA